MTTAPTPDLARHGGFDGAAGRAGRVRGRAERAIDRADWVSFDVFDTLLERRTLRPVHLFSLLRDELALESWMHGVDHADFVRERMRAERLARRTKRIALGTPEATLGEIWAEFARRRTESDRPEMSEDDVATAMRAEISVESRTLAPRHVGLELWRHACRRGKRVIAVSDMYHDSATVRQWLSDAGVEIDEVFVSCEVGVGKRDGMIGRVASRLGLATGSGLHIGDKPDVDGEGARRDGVASVVVPNGTDLLLGPPSVTDSVMPPSESMLLSRAAHHWSDGRTGDLGFDLGYSHLGPAVAGYAAFVHGAATRFGSELVMFTSRDTRMVFDLVEASAVPREYDSRYVHLSRQSLHVPALADGMAESDLQLLVGGAWAQPAGTFLERLGLDVAEHGDALRAAGLDVSEPIADRADRARIAAVLRRLEPDIVAVAGARLEQLLAYLGRVGVLGASQVTLAELGWRGTVQSALDRCLRIHGWRGRIEGTYLGLLWSPFPPRGLSTRAWLTGQPRDELFHGALHRSVPPVELMFQADERSVERYENGSPVLSGDVHSREILDPIQQGALRFALDNRAAIDGLVGDGIPSTALGRPLARLVGSPTSAEARLLGGCRYSDGFGTTATVRRLLPEPRSFGRVFRRVEPDGGQWPAGRKALGFDPLP